MITIKNINNQYGESVEFDGGNLADAVAKMAEAVSACGDDFKVSVEDLKEGVDYEIIT